MISIMSKSGEKPYIFSWGSVWMIDRMIIIKTPQSLLIG